MAAALKPRSDTPIALPGAAAGCCAAPTHPVPCMPNLDNIPPGRPSPNPPYSPPRSATPPSTPSSPPTYDGAAGGGVGSGETGDHFEIDCPACRLQVEVTSSTDSLGTATATSASFLPSLIAHQITSSSLNLL